MALGKFADLMEQEAVRTNPWVIKSLVAQLYDPSEEVNRLALQILLHAADHRRTLELIIEQQPALLHFGDEGIELLTMFLTHPAGFRFLEEREFIQAELARWQEFKALDYVNRVEQLLAVNLTTHSDPAHAKCHDQCSMKPSGSGKLGQVKTPIHFFGELCQLPAGAHTLDEADVVGGLCELVYSALDEESSDEQLHSIKAALWSLGHIASSAHGLKLLAPEFFATVTALAESAPVFSVRGSAYFRR